MDPLSRVLSKNFDGPVLVHSDLMGILNHLNIDLRKAIKEINRNNNLMEEMNSMLKRIIGERDLWIPAYNYDFSETGIYDIQNSPSQVGSLAEYFRKKKAHWRTETPIFSHSGIGETPYNTKMKVIDPVGTNSNFHELVERNGILLFFGVQFLPTHTLYVERITGEGPLYRYDKIFKGKIINKGKSKNVTLNLHVRPRDLTLKYRMPLLFDEFIANGMVKKLPDEFGRSYVISAKELTHYWKDKLTIDPFYLLDDESRKKMSQLVNQKGRRLNINDFDDQDFTINGSK